jgi:ATP-dependent protease ClpP protease subunit
MIHQPSMGGIRGQASDIKVEAEMILGIRERVVRRAHPRASADRRAFLAPSQRRSSQARARPPSLSSAV